MIGVVSGSSGCRLSLIRCMKMDQALIELVLLLFEMAAAQVLKWVAVERKQVVVELRMMVQRAPRLVEEEEELRQVRLALLLE